MGLKANINSMTVMELGSLIPCIRDWERKTDAREADHRPLRMTAAEYAVANASVWIVDGGAIVAQFGSLHVRKHMPSQS